MKGKGCKHGKTWDEPCAECERVWLENVTMPQIARSCERVAQFLEEQPGLATDPRVMIDLYRAVGRLAYNLGRNNGGTIDIVFDGPPGPQGGRFVEVERDGRSIRIGEWVEREDGYWALRIPDPDGAQTGR